MPKDQFIILAGTPLSGYQIVGPFKSETAAEIYAEHWFENKEFWVTEMEEPYVENHRPQ